MHSFWTVRTSGSEKSGFCALFCFWNVIVLSCLYLGSIGLEMLYDCAWEHLVSTDTRRFSICFYQESVIISLRSLWFFEIPVVLGVVVIDHLQLHQRSAFLHAEGNSPADWSWMSAQFLSKRPREKQKSLEMLSNAVVGVEALWCHLDCFSFHDGCIGLECDGTGSPCTFTVTLL